jgi:hypothetical protein
MGHFWKVGLKNTLVAKTKKDTEDSRTYRGYFRQYFQDMRLNDDFINTDNINAIFDGMAEPYGNSEYTWYFHDFDEKKGKPPTGRDITLARKWLCKSPKIDGIRKYFKSNLSMTPGEARAACALRAVMGIQKRDTKSYVIDLLEPYASSDKLDIQAFVDIVKTLAD